jgi:hypothetical protein
VIFGNALDAIARIFRVAVMHDKLFINKDPIYESATDSRSGFSRKIRRPATFDFCNTIGTKPTSIDVHYSVATGGIADARTTGRKRRSMSASDGCSAFVQSDAQIAVDIAELIHG